MKDICSECGDRKILNSAGVCANRHACEHRQFQHKARVDRLLAEMDQQSWHRKVQKHIDFYDRYSSGSLPRSAGYQFLDRTWGDAWNRHPSNQDPGQRREKWNKWLDQWLTRPWDEEE